MLLVGDLARLPEREAVDVLIVSAFPDNYVPTPASLIGALDRAGVSVAELAQDKEVDLRRFSSCWLSHPIERAGVHFRRVLCFEPRQRGKAPEVVGDVFRSIVPFTTGSPPVSQVAMPLLASGDQGESPEVMLDALADASVRWLGSGLPLERVKLVIRPSADSASLREAFSRVKRRHAESAPAARHHGFRFDVFVSYSQKNKTEVDALVRQLLERRPALRVFVDRLELRPGAAWQQHIFECLDQSRKVICAFSPEYLASKVCKEEFHIAWFRHREAADGVLLPVYLYSTELPTYMKLVHYEDVREGDRAKIAQSAERLLAQL
jgi:hypothetical protein